MHSATSGRVSALARLWRGSSLRSLQRFLRVSSIRRSWPAFFFGVMGCRVSAVCLTPLSTCGLRETEMREGVRLRLRVGPCLIWPYSVRSGGCEGGVMAHGLCPVWPYSVRSLAERGSVRDADETVSCIRGTLRGARCTPGGPAAPRGRGRPYVTRFGLCGRPQSCPLRRLCPVAQLCHDRGGAFQTTVRRIRV